MRGTIYYARPVTTYGTARDDETKALLGDWNVLDPSGEWHQSMYAAVGMIYFEALVGECDALAFLRFDDGEIGAGVGKEIAEALARDLPVYDVSDGTMVRIHDLPRVLTVEETRARIALAKASMTTPDSSTIGG